MSDRHHVAARLRTFPDAEWFENLPSRGEIRLAAEAMLGHPPLQVKLRALGTLRELAR